MRQRVAEAKPAAGPWDIKLAQGGLPDLEFTLAFLLLRVGAAYGTPPPGTKEALKFLHGNGAIREEDAKGLLTAAELFETIVQLGRAATGDQFAPSASGEALKARMAAACGAATIAEAEEGLKARQHAVKRIYDEVVVAAASASPAGTAP
jgi:glutamate-ammonia-ligase adenylyltransferase